MTVSTLKHSTRPQRSALRRICESLERNWLFERPVEVFLSSTSSLKDERLAVREALDERVYRLFCFEDHQAEKRSPRTVCEEKIDQADVFLGLVGPDFGSPLPTDAKCGIVHWEFDHARERASHFPLALKPYVRRDALDHATDQRQRDFIERITDFDNGAWVKLFGDPVELKGIVATEMREWVERTREACARAEPNLDRLASRLLTPIVLLAVTSSVTAGVLALINLITRDSAVLVAFISIAIILACQFLRKQF